MASEPPPDLESPALLKDKSKKSYGIADVASRTTDAMKATSTVCAQSAKKTVRRMVHREQVKDAMTYHTQELGSWNSLVYLSFTVWHRRTLWLLVLRLWVMSLLIAILVLVTVPDPASLRVEKFVKISDFLRVFVGLLLGFFMAASVNRWWGCAEALIGLCGAIRKLQMMLQACGIPDEEIQHVLRYGVLSAWTLSIELHVEALPEEERDTQRQKEWLALRLGDEYDETFAHLRTEEADLLQTVSDPPCTLWVWIGVVMGRMAEKGLIRTLAAPSFARCMTLAGEGFDKILKVRSSISVQAPYIYLQMLASLVHINNIVNALSFGMTSGAALGTAFQRAGIPLWRKPASKTEATHDMQALLVSFFLSCFGPLVYQALLETSIAIAQPFSNNDAVVPTKRIIRLLERDLHDAMGTTRVISENKDEHMRAAKAAVGFEEKFDDGGDGGGGGDGGDGGGGDGGGGDGY